MASGVPSVLETERLRLRDWLDSDREPFAELNANPEAMRYFPAPYSREQSDHWVDRASASIKANGFGFWALERKEDLLFLGFVGLNRPAYELPFGPCVEIGWRLHPDHWGRGYATEAGKRVLRYAFEDLDLEEVVSFTGVRNLSSEKVMQRIGMDKDANTFLHPKVDPASDLAEHLLYRICREIPG